MTVSGSPGASEQVGGEALVLALLRYRRLAARAVVTVAVFTAAAVLLMPRTWTARGSFVAQGGRGESLGALAGLASQFGFNLAGASGGYPPRFFAALVTSDEVLGAVVGQPAPLSAVDSGGSVADALGVTGATPEIRRARAIAKARRNIVGALYDQRTGLTGFWVTTKDAALSAQIAHTVVDEINRFNAERHQSRASAERRFAEARREAIASELRSSEEEVRSFLVRNRSYESSPERQLEYDRLRRRVSDLSTVFTSLTQSYEQARIEEVRDTPVLTLVESPAIPVLPDRRRLVQWVIGSAVLALFVVTGWIVALQLLGVLGGRRPAEPVRLAAYWPVLAAEARRPWSWLL